MAGELITAGTDWWEYSYGGKKHNGAFQSRRHKKREEAQGDYLSPEYVY